MKIEGGDEAAIGEFAAPWNRQQSYEVNGVGAGGNVGANNLGNSAKVVGVGANPDGFVWIAAEVLVFEILAGIGVNGGVGFGAVGTVAERITMGSQSVCVGQNDMLVGTERSALVWRSLSRGWDAMWRNHPQR